MEENNSKILRYNISNYSVILLILSIIVSGNTNKDGFIKVMKNGLLYYEFYQMILWSSIVPFITIVPLSCLIFNTKNGYKYIGCYKTITLLIILGIVVTQILAIGRIWNVDNHHSIFFYKDFWIEGVTNFTHYQQVHNKYLRGSSNVVTNQWGYEMSDIVVRIYGSIILLSLIFFPCCISN